MTAVTDPRPAFRLVSPTATREIALLATIVAVGAVFSLASPYFLTVSNLVQTLRAGLELAIVSGGMTLVIIMGGIDVSVGGILAVSAIIIGKAYQAGLPAFAVAPIGLFTGTVLGAFNGVLTAKLKVPPIVATLGSMYVFSAIMFLVIGGAWIAGLPGTLSPLVNGTVGFVPASAIVILAVYLACWVVLRRLPFGRHIYAIGCNEQSARLVGINVDRIKILGFMVSGMCAALTGILLASRLGSGTTSAADSYLLTAFAAVFLGSATMRDGEFHVLGTFVGVLIIAFGFNGLNIFGAPTFSQYIFQGAILIVAVGLASLGRMISES